MWQHAQAANVQVSDFPSEVHLRRFPMRNRCSVVLQRFTPPQLAHLCPTPPQQGTHIQHDANHAPGSGNQADVPDPSGQRHRRGRLQLGRPAGLPAEAIYQRLCKEARHRNGVGHGALRGVEGVEGSGQKRGFLREMPAFGSSEALRGCITAK
eukprot:scaffold122_cov236-Pinguiococcus_pyrenoidosus.AAC.4